MINAMCEKICRIILATSVVVVMTVACSDYGIDEKEASVKLVVEGHIDSGGYPVVILTASASPAEGNIAISDKLIRWGKVTISDGDTTIIMTGGPNKKYFPPYTYSTFRMKGKPGHTYSITASYDYLNVSASVTMPEPPHIDSIVVNDIAEADTLRSATIHFTAADEVPAYYHLSTRVIGIDSLYLPAMMGCYKATVPGEKVKMAVYRGKSGIVSGAKYVPQLPKNYDVSVRLERVSKQVYDFWSAFDNASMFGGSQFVTVDSSLPSNIEGGYGVWSAQGVDFSYIKCEDAD